MSILHYMGYALDPQTLAVGQCTIRPTNNRTGWRLWLCVPDGAHNGTPVVRQVPIRPNGDPDPVGPAFACWGLKSVGPGTQEWQVQPSIHMKGSAGEDVWHETPKLVNVPDNEPWARGDFGARRIRLIHQIGRRAGLRIYWDTVEYENGVTKKYQNTCAGRGEMGGTHEAIRWVSKKIGNPDDFVNSFGTAEDYPPEAWPTQCDACGATVPTETLYSRPSGENFTGMHLYGDRQLFESGLWNTTSGDVEIADAFWATPEGRMHAHSHTAGQCYNWDNCDNRHLKIRLPDGHIWDVMGRASNCTRRDDKTHRCWVISGDVANGTLTIGKGGDTCTAGAGSIDTGKYHGMVTNGVLAP